MYDFMFYDATITIIIKSFYDIKIYFIVLTVYK